MALFIYSLRRISDISLTHREIQTFLGRYNFTYMYVYECAATVAATPSYPGNHYATK